MRNQFEEKVAKQLGPDWKYEDTKLSYTISHTYTPDFINYETKTIIESKGRLTGSDRAKMIAVKRQNPEWTIIFLFQSPHQRITKASKTTYAQWATKNGFQWRALDKS